MDKKALFKGSSSVLSLSSIARILGLGIKVVISRLMGPAGLGVYELVLAITRLGSMIPQMGLHQTAVYYVSRFYARQKDKFALYVIRQGLAMVLLFSVTVGVTVWLFEDNLASIFFEEYPETWAVITCALLIPLFSIKNFISFCYRGMKRVSMEVILNKVCYPLLALAGIGLFLLFGETLNINLFLKILVVATAIPVLWGVMGLGKSLLIPIKLFREKVIGQKMLIYSMPIWINTVMSIGIAQIDRIFIGAFSTSEEVGFYGAAYSFSFIISFILGSFNPISQPLISESYSDRDFDRIQDIYCTIVDWTGYLVIPLLGGFFLFGESMLGLVFGEEFKVAYWILCILGVAESINALSGPAGNILIMTSHQKVSVYSLSAGLISGIIFNLILIPKYGALGAAIGTGLSIALINIIRVYQIKVYLNITNRYNNLLKVILVVILSFIISYFLKQHITNLILEVVIYAVMILGGYIGVLRLHKIILEDIFDFKTG